MHILRLDESVLGEFREFLAVDLRLAPSTVLNTVEDVKRFLKSSGFVVSYATIKTYLKGYLGKAPKTYNGQITSLRRFVKAFLGRPELVASFRMAPVDESCRYTDVSKAQVRRGFNAQQETRTKAIYLFTATTGLRKGEILSITKENVDFDACAVTANHFTRKKRSGITFYNTEAQNGCGNTWMKEETTIPGFLLSAIVNGGRSGIGQAGSQELRLPRRF